MFAVTQPWSEKQMMASCLLDLRALCMWTDSKSRHASLRMVRLINNLYSKDEIAVLPFDSICLTTHLWDGTNNTHTTWGGGVINSLWMFCILQGNRLAFFEAWTDQREAMKSGIDGFFFSPPLLSIFYLLCVARSGWRLMEFSRTRLKLLQMNAASLH